MANDIPLISRRAGAPITSAGGSGGAALGTLGTSTSRTPDMTGVGGALGSLVGALVAARPSGSTPNQNRTPTPIPRPVEERPIEVQDRDGNNQSGGGLSDEEKELLRDYYETSGSSYVSPTNNPWSGKTPGGLGEFIGGGGTGTAGSIKYPRGTTQEIINADMGTTNGKPNAVIAGVNMSTGEVIAQPNYNIGPNFDSTVYYDTDKYFSGAGDLGSFTGKDYYDTDDYFSGAGDLGSFADTSGAETFPYDFSNELTSNQITDMLGGGRESPVISMDGFDVDDLFSSGFFDDLLPSFDFDTSGSFFDDFGSSLSDFGSDIFDFFTPSSFSFGDLFSKDGGHVNKYANGGNVRGYVDGGNVLTGGAIGGGLGALIGRLLSGRTTGRVNTGVDMSKVGVIPPKTTDFGVGPARYVPFREYSPRTAAPQFNMPSAQPNYAEIMRNLGVPGFADGGSASYYTYGTPVDAKAVLRGSGMPVPAMKSGGLPKATAPMTMDGRHDYRHGQYVDGIGDGQSDEIPAMLADGEYVIDSDTVAALGNGSNKAGAKLLDGMRKEIRAHKRSAPVDKIPPKAKSPLEYMRMGAMKKGRK